MGPGAYVFEEVFEKELPTLGSSLTAVTQQDELNVFTSHNDEMIGSPPEDTMMPPEAVG